VWFDHLRRGDVLLVDLLEHGDVVMHPFVAGPGASNAGRFQAIELQQRDAAGEIA